MRDEKIVELYWHRDEDAIKATEEKYGAYLTKIAMNILSDPEDSKESVNDTYLAAWDSIPPNRPASLSSYLSKLVRRISIDLYRTKNREKRKASQYSLSLSELSDIIADRETPEDSLELEILGAAISEFLRTRKKVVRTAFIGRYYYLDSVKEVARYCNMSESQLKTMLYRTRKELRAYLEKEGFYV